MPIEPSIKGLVSAITKRLPLSGGTMTGFLTLNDDPTDALHAVTKQYADALIGGGPAGPFVRKNTADTITAVHTFNPTVAGAPFILGANALNQLVTGLNSDLLDSQSGAFYLARGNHTGTQAPATISPQGSGSGLDADLLDGQHAAAFQPIDAGLTALASLGAGIAVTDGADAWVARSLAVTDSSSVDFTLTNASGVAGNPTITAVVLPAGVDHNLLANLATGDVHTQYLVLTGRAGTANDPLISTGAIGTITGSDDASGVLALLGSSNATKGPVRVNDVAFTHSGTLGMLQIGGTITAAGGTLNYLEIAQVTGTPRVVSLSGGIVGRAVIFQPSVRNSTAGVANDLGAWILFGNAAQYRTNNTTGTTVTEVRTFADSPLFNQITGGTIVCAVLTSLDCRPTINTGGTVTLRRGVRFLNNQGVGTQTDVIGFDYETQTVAGVNYAFRNQDANATITTAGFLEGILGTGNPLQLRSNSLNDGQIRLGAVESAVANVVVNGSTADITFEGPTLVKSFLTIHDSKTTLDGYSSTNAATVLLKKYNDTLATAAPRVYFSRSRGTQAIPAAVQDDDYLGRIDFLGFGGTIYRRAVRLSVEVDDMAPDDTQIGGAFIIQTAGSPGALTDRLRIDAAGYSQFSGSVGIRGLAYVWPSANAAGYLRNNGSGTLSWDATGAGIDHGGLGGLGDDDHSIYTLRTGRTGTTNDTTLTTTAAGTGTLYGGSDAAAILALRASSSGSAHTGSVQLDDPTVLWPSFPIPTAASTVRIVDFARTLTPNLAHTLYGVTFRPAFTMGGSQTASWFHVGGTYAAGVDSSAVARMLDVDTVYSSASDSFRLPQFTGVHLRHIYESNNVDIFNNAGATGAVRGFDFQPTIRVVGASGSATFGITTMQANRAAPAFTTATAGQVIDVGTLIGYNFAPTHAGSGALNITTSLIALSIGAVPTITGAPVIASVRATDAAWKFLHQGGGVFGGSTALTNASVGLEIQGTTLAFLLSRMTDAQRATLTGVAVADGMMLYDSTRNTISARMEGRWNDVPGWNVIIVKSADQTVTNTTTLTDDTELQFAVLANEVWHVELRLGMSGNNATSDAKFGLTSSIASFVVAQSNWDGVHYTTAAVLTNVAPTAFASTTEAVTGGTACVDAGTSTTIWPVRATYRFRASANATIKVQFALAAGAAAGRNAVMEAGSMLLARRIS